MTLETNCSKEARMDDEVRNLTDGQANRLVADVIAGLLRDVLAQVRCAWDPRLAALVFELPDGHRWRFPLREPDEPLDGDEVIVFSLGDWIDDYAAGLFTRVDDDMRGRRFCSACLREVATGGRQVEDL